MSLGLQQLDLFLSRILNVLFHQSDKLPNGKLQLLLNYDPQRTMTPIAYENPLTAGIIYLGNKGFNLVKLKRYGIPVPPGFIITTEAFRCRDIIQNYIPAIMIFLPLNIVILGRKTILSFWIISLLMFFLLV